jgi:hypothetical protein
MMKCLLVHGPQSTVHSRAFKVHGLLVVVFLLGSIALSGQSMEKDYPESFQVAVTNPLAMERKQVLVVLTPGQIKAAARVFNERAFVVMDGKVEVASQYNRGDADQAGIVFILDKLGASESRQLTVRYDRGGTRTRNYVKRAQAELSYKTGGAWRSREYIGGAFQNTDYLRVPPEHKDHSWFIRYEGPGWESDRVGYRFYLDQRNAADVFGKKTPAMVLQNVGQDGFDSYHNPQPWGMDVMKVGKSLGIGSIGAMADGKVTRVEKTDSVDCRVVENGPVYASLLTRYFGWQVGNSKHDVRSRLSIHGGTRLTHAMLSFTNAPALMVTGIVKDNNARLLTNAGDAKHWAYLATYGQQSLNSDNLGLVVFFKPGDVVEVGGDEFSEFVKLKVKEGNAEYYYGAAWIGEPGGIQDERQFLAYLGQVSQELAMPVQVRVKAK